MILTVKGKRHLLLGPDDKCPICDRPTNDIYGEWNFFHGEITSYCCGAVYQTKDYYIEKPTVEEKELLKMLAGEYIEFNIKQEWVEPLKKAMKELGETNISENGVQDLAEKYLKESVPQA